MYSILLGVQYASIGLMLFMCAYITKKWSKPVHGWLFFYCCVTLINNAGYLGCMISRTEGEALLSLQMSYLGRVWIPFSLLNFVIQFCTEKRYPKITTPLAIVHALVYFLMVLVKKTTLYYGSVTFIQDGIFPHITHTSGIFYYFYTILILSYIVFALILLFKTMQKQKNSQKRKQIVFITLAIVTDSVFYLIGKIPVFFCGLRKNKVIFNGL